MIYKLATTRGRVEGYGAIELQIFLCGGKKLKHEALGSRVGKKASL